MVITLGDGGVVAGTGASVRQMSRVRAGQPAWSAVLACGEENFFDVPTGSLLISLIPWEDPEKGLRIASMNC